MRLFEGAGLWRGRRSRAAPALSVAALMVLLSTAFTIGSGRDLDRVNLTSGGAWLASPQRGFVTLIDGPSEQIVATVAAAPASTGVSVTQAGTSAFISDNTLGTVARIDGATYEISPAVRFGSAGSQLSVVAGRNAAFVVDATARVATVANATDLTVVRTVSLGARPGNQQTLADDSGRLWAVDSENGGLSWFDSNGDRDQTGADPAARLIEVAGRAAIAEFGESGQGFAWLTPDGGRDSWKCQLPTRAGDQLQLLGSAEAEHAFVVVSETGTVILADSSGELCGTAIKIAEPGADLGPPVQSGRFVLVPVRSKGTTAVIDTASATLVADLPLTVAGNDLELLNKDGIVFYNDLDSERAGVIRLEDSGSWVAGKALQKYNPETGEAENIVAPTGTMSAAPPEQPAPAALTQESAATDSNATAQDRSRFSSAEPSIPPALPSIQQSPASAIPGSTSSPSPTVVTSDSNADTSDTETIASSARSSENPSLTPVVTAINASGPLLAGLSATFRGEVEDSSGGWKWIAKANDGRTLAESETVGDFIVDLPIAGVDQVTITLSVGSSTPLSRQFGIVPAFLSTRTIVSVSKTNAWIGDKVKVSVEVVPADQRYAQFIPAGYLDMSRSNSNEITDRYEPLPLENGRADYPVLEFDLGDPGSIKFAAKYSGDPTHQESSGESPAITVIQGPSIELTTCQASTLDGSPSILIAVQISADSSIATRLEAVISPLDEDDNPLNSYPMGRLPSHVQDSEVPDILLTPFRLEKPIQTWNGISNFELRVSDPVTGRSLDPDGYDLVGTSCI